MNSLIISSLLSTTEITVSAPFEYAGTATNIAAAAGAVLALTFGWMVGFRLVKKVIRRLAGQA